MVVAQDKVVLLHYTLTNDTGTVLDSSSGDEPLAYIHGQGNLVSGLEKALEGKQAGDKLNVDVAPADGYGVYDPALVKRVPMRAFGNTKNVKPGLQFQAQISGQKRLATVKAIQGDMVMIDANHPLVGENLHFNVEIAEVREASQEELEHGHVHGAGGHHHG